jgi:hypothetical protein
MTASQPIASRPGSSFAGAIDQVHHSRYLETRH